MTKRRLLTGIAAWLMAVQLSADIDTLEGLLPGVFSVSDSTYVQFSKGNLQYHANLATWQFAEHQWDTIGIGNNNISSSYDGWIDLFGYGTGQNPTLTSSTNGDYMNYDEWGANAISNGGNADSLWRTLTNDEWMYLFSGRDNAQYLFGMGSVDGINGTILLPDDWDPGDWFDDTDKGLTYQSDGFYKNTALENYNFHSYDLDSWAEMEAQGAVFLPAAGYRYSTSTSNTNEDGNYWAVSSACRYLFFDSQQLMAQQTSDSRFGGRSVRLVEDVQPLITTMDLSVTCPQAGEEIVKGGLRPGDEKYTVLGSAIVSPAAGYKIFQYEFTDANRDDITEDYFLPNTTYTMTICVEAKYGYAFPKDIDGFVDWERITARVNGQIVDDDNVGVNRNIFFVYVHFSPTPTGVEEVTGDGLQVTGCKVLRDGQLYLMHRGRMYDVQGKRVR